MNKHERDEMKKMLRAVFGELAAEEHAATAARQPPARAAAPAPAEQPAQEVPKTSKVQQRELDPVACAAASAPFTTAQEGHKQVYRMMHLLANNILENIGDPRMMLHYVRATHKLALICSEAATHLGSEPGVGLNAMLRYINGQLLNCVVDPEAVTFSATLANSTLAATRAAEGPRPRRPSGPGGRDRDRNRQQDGTGKRGREECREPYREERRRNN